MSRSRGSLGVVLVAAVFAGALGPRFTEAPDKRAGTAFEYVPPEGFVVQPKGTTEAILGSASVDKAWIYPNLAGFTPNVTVTTSAKSAVTDMAELDALVKGMPSTFSSAGIAWTEVRHEIRGRADGARVAVVTGDCERGTLHYRMMQMVFPHDAGTAIVTASFPSDSAAKWERSFEDSIEKAAGVAVRRPPTPLWLHVAWGGGAGLLVYLAMALRGGRSRGEAKRTSTPPAKSKRHPADADADDEAQDAEERERGS